MSNRFRVITLFTIFLCSCARQGTIPNTDRFPPHLLTVVSPVQNEVHLTFDEKLNPSAILLESFKLTSPVDTPSIRFITSGTGDFKKIILFTSALESQTYEISGLVVDENNNSSTIRAKFRPSANRDTFPPNIFFSPSDTQTTFPFRVSLLSNEPVDTSRGWNIISIPYSPSTSIFWRKDLNRLEIAATDSSLKTHPFYLVLIPGIRDYAGNRLKTGLSTFIYPDTLSKLFKISGHIKTEGYDPSGYMLILLKAEEKVIAGTLADSTGFFSLNCELPDSFKIEAWVDCESDGLFDEAGNRTYTSLPDSIELSTTRLSSPRSLKQIVQENQ